MDSRKRDNLLMIAARKPVAGQAKTRLGASIGMERAAMLYRSFLADLAGRFMRNTRGFDLAWAYTPESEPFDEVIAELCPARPVGDAWFVRQEGSDWAERQANLLRWGADQGYACTVLTASDSPQMTQEMVESAFAALTGSDVVVGRVHDGGYYLVGVRGYHDVVSGVPMGTASAAEALIARACGMGLRVATVCPTFDIDVEADLAYLVELLDRDARAAPLTSVALVSLGLAPYRAFD